MSRARKCPGLVDHQPKSDQGRVCGCCDRPVSTSCITVPNAFERVSRGKGEVGFGGALGAPRALSAGATAVLSSPTAAVVCSFLLTSIWLVFVCRPTSVAWLENNSRRANRTRNYDEQACSDAAVGVLVPTSVVGPRGGREYPDGGSFRRGAIRQQRQRQVKPYTRAAT